MTIGTVGIVALMWATTIDASSCGTNPPPSPSNQSPPSASVSVATATINISLFSFEAGQSLQLVATVRDGNGGVLTGRSSTWSSSSPEVADVSPSGLVTAMAIGNSVVSVAVEGKSASTTINVHARARYQFNFSRELIGSERSLFAVAQSLDASSRRVTVGGVDTRRLISPFMFDWGDGTFTTGFFNQSHTYPTASRNYTVRVTAYYSPVDSDYYDVVVRFVAPQIQPINLPQELSVTIPNPVPSLVGRQGRAAPPGPLLPFDDAYFSTNLPRGHVEYVLSQASAIEFGILGGDVELVNGEFRQVMLRDPNFGGAYSIWFTNPAAVGAGASFFQGNPEYSSLFHEMGHNLSLNSPAAFPYGGKVDGPANAIFTEAVAQMFQHVVAYEIANNSALYGVPADLALEIFNNARLSASGVRRFYDNYVRQGKQFGSWNDPVTEADETFGTFMVVARQFLVHAEQAQSYVIPLTRTMRLLRTFNQAMLAQYAPQTNNETASTFRSTLMVAAVSYGFQADLRSEFRALNFPIDDSIFATLYASIP